MKHTNPFGLPMAEKEHDIQPTLDYAVKGMVDVSTMAMVGTMGIGMMGMMGSMIKK